MTLGDLIDALERIDPDMTLTYGFDLYPGKPHSYRGYYDRLAFDSVGERTTTGEFVKLAEECVGKTFEGYKGGEFTMDRNTPVYVASYGRTGERLVGVLLRSQYEARLVTSADDPEYW